MVAVAQPLPELPLRNRRYAGRVAFHLAAQVVGTRRSWPTRVVDLCMGGALVLRPHGSAPATGEKVRLVLELEDGPLTLEATVAYSRGSRIGLRCSCQGAPLGRLRRLVEAGEGGAEAGRRQLNDLG